MHDVRGTSSIALFGTHDAPGPFSSRGGLPHFYRSGFGEACVRASTDLDVPEPVEELLVFDKRDPNEQNHTVESTSP